MNKQFTNAERCQRRRIKRDYEERLADYYARGGTEGHLALPYGWTDAMLQKRLNIINNYRPTFLGYRIKTDLFIKQVAQMLNKTQNPSLLYCQLGTQITLNYNGLPDVIIGLLHKAYNPGTPDLYFEPEKVVDLLKNILTLDELAAVKDLL